MVMAEPSSTSTAETTTTTTPPPPPPPLVSDEELQQCVSILSRFHGEQGLERFQLPRYKPLRKAVMPLLADVRAKFFHGQSADQDAHRQEKKRKIKIERARQKALDQKFINNTQLRAERLARLAQLTAANPLLAQVPDGATARSGRLLTVESERNADADADVETDLAAQSPRDEEEEEKQTHDGHAATAMDTDMAAELHHHRTCYTCKLKFRQLHHFYDRMCPSCAAFNFQKRLQVAQLQDHVAIVTGARVKIGFEIALKLLRSGAIVVATTRFPKDAAVRFARETDFLDWRDRVHVYGLDFRDLGVIDTFMDHIASTFGRVDILINNATQTIRRPVHYYKHLLAGEAAPLPEAFASAQSLLQGNLALLGGDASRSHATNGSTVSTETGAIVQANEARLVVAAPVAGSGTSAAVPSSVLLSQVVVVPEDRADNDTAALFPEGQVDTNQQQVDLRKKNTWVQKISEIETMELVEVFAINTMAPFILNKRVIPLLEKSTNANKFIINVSAMEGKFYRVKTANHPHTNMAKAAANMMTRTCAEDLAQKGIFMNSVDTGWINDENPREAAARIATKHNFQTPLDEVDAAARVLDPIFVLHQEGHAEPPMYGQFLKDYKISEW